MALYSDKVMDHFRNPRNVGVIEDADGVGEVGNAKFGDIMKMYLKMDDDIISDVKFDTFGCGSAIASSSMATELIKGKPLSDAMQLTNKAVTEALDGLPAHKLHCSVLAEEAIRLKEESTALREQNRDYALLRKVFGSKQVDDIVAQAKEAQQETKKQRLRAMVMTDKELAAESNLCHRSI